MSQTGPTIAACRFNQDHPQRVAALDRDFLAFLTNWNRGSDRAVWDAEYLLVTATKRWGAASPHEHLFI